MSGAQCGATGTSNPAAICAIRRHSVTPPQTVASAWMMWTERSSRNWRNGQRVDSSSPVASGIAVRFESSAKLPPRPAGTALPATTDQGAKRSAARIASTRCRPGIVCIECQATFASDQLAHQLHPRHIHSQRLAADLDLDRVESTREVGGDLRLQVLKRIDCCVVASRRIDGDVAAEAAQHAVERQAGVFGIKIPERDIEAAHCAHPRAPATEKQRPLVEHGPELFGHRRIPADRDRRKLLLDDVMEDAGAAGIAAAEPVADAKAAVLADHPDEDVFALGDGAVDQHTGFVSGTTTTALRTSTIFIANSGRLDHLALRPPSTGTARPVM